MSRIRRPSAAMVIALVALFVALGGVSWAAIALPAGSVGTKQLRNGAVTSKKIARGAVSGKALHAGAVTSRAIGARAVGLRQIDPRAVQARVTGTCGGGTAIAAVDAGGGVSCASTLPAAAGTADQAPVTLPPGGQSTVATQQLPSGAFLVLAEPEATITGSPGEGVDVSCTLSVSSAATKRTRMLRVEVGPTGAQLVGSIPLALVAPSGGTASVGCADSVSPAGASPATVTVQSALEAIEVQHAQ